MQLNHCLECGEPLKGRIDKKFCCDQCRNLYNNRERRVTNNYIRKVNNTLRKNRMILETCSPEGKSRIHRSKLLNMGFNFHYYTNTYKTKTGNLYFFCYEYGYLPLQDDMYTIVLKEEYVD